MEFVLQGTKEQVRNSRGIEPLVFDPLKVYCSNVYCLVYSDLHVNFYSRIFEFDLSTFDWYRIGKEISIIFTISFILEFKTSALLCQKGDTSGRETRLRTY